MVRWSDNEAIQGDSDLGAEVHMTRGMQKVAMPYWPVMRTPWGYESVAIHLQARIG